MTLGHVNFVTLGHVNFVTSPLEVNGEKIKYL